MNDLIRKIEQWGNDKGIIKKDNAFKQLAKFNEEQGEMSKALLLEDREKLIDGIGDVSVTLIILAKQNGLNFEDCLNAAWNEIKDRKGVTKEGIFIKN